VEETWARTPELLWKFVARELMQSPIADKKVIFCCKYFRYGTVLNDVEVHGAAIIHKFVFSNIK
jgi:hypothetical protein